MAGDPIAVVRRYLEATEARRLDEADGFLAPGAELIFPGGRYRSVREMVKAAAGRYRWARKTFAEWDVATRRDGTAIVISTGTLSGENLHGVRFEGVRYIDRFVVRDGRILIQQVWNDLEVSGVLTRRNPA